VNLEELVGDPLFQLNFILWQAQPLPVGMPFSIRALLNEAGYSVHSIALNLSLRPHLRADVEKKGVAAQHSASPDVILKKRLAELYVLAEAKTSSFSTSSSSASQARTFLLLQGDNLVEALGLAVGTQATGIVTYLMKSDQCAQMRNTLESLTKELKDGGFTCNEHCCLGLKAEPGIVKVVVETSDAKLLGLSESGEVKVYEADPETDPRPLYFIPFDPDVEQSSEEAAYAREALEQRVQSELIAAIGKVTPPTNIQLVADELLEKATWGMYRLWKSGDTRRHLRTRINEFVSKTLTDKVLVSDGRRCIQIASAEEKDEIIGILMRTKPESWRGAGAQLSFDELAENAEKPKGHA